MLHEKSPLHALVGGGDQIYNDALWFVPSLKAWLDVPSAEVNLIHPVSLPRIFFSSNQKKRDAAIKPKRAPGMRGVPASQVEIMNSDDAMQTISLLP